MPCTIATCINKINIFISVRELVRTKGLRSFFLFSIIDCFKASYSGNLLIPPQQDCLANKLVQEHRTAEKN